MSKQKKSIFEEFAVFYEKPTREALRNLLKNNLGEFPNCDFKEQWPEFSKVARHILGIANSGGGCIVIGIAENADKSLEAKGIDPIIDKSQVINGVKKYIPGSLLSDLDILDMSYDAAEYPKLVGKKFQVVLVSEDVKRLPYVATAEGAGIRNNAIYVRRGVSTEEANHDELQRIVNARLDSGYSSQSELNLEAHIEHLRLLYKQIEKNRVYTQGGVVQVAAQALGPALASYFGETKLVPNPHYPKESIDAFFSRMIERKKKRIEIELDLINL